MPELPEIKAHAERLHALFEGVVLDHFRVLHPSALKTFDPRPDSLNGLAVRQVTHRGKHLLVEVDRSEPAWFVIHLMQGGRLRPDPKQSPRPRGGMARWTFADGRALLLTEAGTEHRAGVWVVSGDTSSSEPLTGLGPDADTVTREELSVLLKGKSERLHGWLRNQQNIAGIGRLLANEVLHAAKISPFAVSSKITEIQTDRLHAAIGSSIERALAHERSLPDMGKSADRPSDVHHRIGEPCPVCGNSILSVEYRRYTVAYCPDCQTGGRKLADNTTSKFLK